MLSSGRRYRIELWVRCSLKFYESKPFRFSLRGAKVELRPLDREDQNEGFVAAVRITCSTLSEAEVDAHDLLAQVLDLISLQYKMPALIEKVMRSQVEESGEIRHCAIYSNKRKPRSFFLMQQQVDEVQRLLGAELLQDVLDALYWLRWSYQQELSPGAFLFAWMALERLVGDEDRQGVCRVCGNPVVCPEHGAHRYRSVSPSKVKNLLIRHGVGNPKALLDLRHPLVHGGLKFTVEKRAKMIHAVPLLWKVVENELKQRLGTKTVVHTSGGGRVRSSVELVNCEYRTSYPAEPFPPDCPTSDDVQDCKNLVRKGREHCKIIKFLAWPPAW